jgi:hypothetical protein
MVQFSNNQRSDDSLDAAIVPIIIKGIKWIAAAIKGAGAAAAVKAGAAIGTCFGNLGVVVANNPKHVIHWSKTNFHGLKRLAERGVTQRMADTWVRTGKALEQPGGKILYVTKEGAVVVGKEGNIITVWTKETFDANMIRVVEQLFGK